MYNHRIVNTVTGEEIVEPLSEAEIAEVEANIVKINAEIAELKAIEEEKLNALSKLKALGLDENDLKALGLG